LRKPTWMMPMSKERPPKSARKSALRIGRRQFVKALVSLGIVGTVASFLSLLMSILPSPKGSLQGGEVSNVLTYGPEKGTWYSDKSGMGVLADDFDQVGKGAGVLWRGSIPAILIRLDESRLRGTTTNNGLLAFASSCTHLCCISTWHIDRPSEDVLFCRCHDGIFDPYDIVSDVMPNGAQYLGAKVVAGPPPRAAPIIQVEIKDGKVFGVPSNLEIFSYCE
jgi:Rieske Fe-S protein